MGRLGDRLVFDKDRSDLRSPPQNPKQTGIRAAFAPFVPADDGNGTIGALGRLAVRHVPNCLTRQANDIIARTVSRERRIHCFPEVKLK